MKKQYALAWGALTLFSLAYAAGNSDWGEYRPFKGSYLIYSNTLGEQQPPTPHERKISFMVTGQWPRTCLTPWLRIRKSAAVWSKAIDNATRKMFPVSGIPTAIGATSALTCAVEKA